MFGVLNRLTLLEAAQEMALGQPRPETQVRGSQAYCHPQDHADMAARTE